MGKGFRLTLIGWYLLGAAVLILVCMLSGCCQKTYESVVRDTVRIERVDSVIVSMREVEVTVPVPQITLSERVPVCDTLLVLDNGLYQSLVEIKDGQVTHTLKPSEKNDGIHTTVTVADTTHVHSEATHTSHTEKEKVTVAQKETWWDKLQKRVGSMVLWLCLLALLLGGLLLWIRNKGSSP